MGKQGPCYHCGVTSTPLWRNGPPEKPILCNACGSRWRTKGTLANYTPLHARQETDDLEDYKVSRVRTLPIKNKVAKVLKRKTNHDNPEIGVFPDYNQGFHRKSLDEDTSNRSSSGSVISNSDSCAQFCSAEASDLTGSAQSNIWDTMVPSRKRTCVGRPKQSSVEKLTKDLYTILHEQSSYFSGTSEEDLLFESDKPMVSVEIGHGSMLIRHPSSIGREEESEASSLSVDNKHHSFNEAYSQLTYPPVNTNNGVNSSNLVTERNKKPTNQRMEQDKIERNKDRLEKLQLLGHHNSPLCHIDLKDVLNYEEFTRHLSSDEQQQLLKYLPPIDSFSPPESLRSMFESSQFAENLSSFQKLLADGVFDNSFDGVTVEECRMLKRLILCYLMKSKWVEQFNLLKDVKCENSSSGTEVAGRLNVTGADYSVNMKRPRDAQHPKYSGVNTTMQSSKKVVMKNSYEPKGTAENDSYCFSPKSLFALPLENSSFVLDSFRSAPESSGQELLLDVQSNSSFPLAELLPIAGFAARPSTSSSSIYLHPARP